jgi:hypothetical protein
LKELLKRYDNGDDIIKNKVRYHFGVFEKFSSEMTLDYYLRRILFSTYDSGNLKSKKYLLALIELSGKKWSTDNEKFMVYLNKYFDIKGMLKILSTIDIIFLGFRFPSFVGEEFARLKEEFARRYKSSDADLRNLKFIDKTRCTKHDDDFNELFSYLIETSTQEERLEMIPDKFHPIKMIIEKLGIDFTIVDYSTHVQDPIREWDFETFIFSINDNDDKANITIRSFPDLRNNLDWILKELGKIENTFFNLTLINMTKFQLPEIRNVDVEFIRSNNKF